MTIRFKKNYKKYVTGQVATLPTKVEFTLTKEGIADSVNDKASIVVATSAAAITAPINTSENTLVTHVIPGGIMGPSGTVVVNLWGSFSGTGNKVFRIKFGGALVGTCTVTTAVLIQSEFSFQNRGSASSQIGQTNSANTYREHATGAFTFTAVNSDVDQPLTITMQKATGAEAAVIERYSIEVVRPLT
jgi:hypothetical protein